MTAPSRVRDDVVFGGFCYWKLAMAGYHRASVYVQAAFAGLITNVTFALIRASILLATVPQGGEIANYDAASLVTFAWVSQGLHSVVLLWGDGELSRRVRNGDVAVDLSRPWNLQTALLAADLGRAAFATWSRLAPPLVIGTLFFPFAWPEGAGTWGLFILSAIIAVMISSLLRFMLELSTFWLLDVKGVATLYNVIASTLSGLTIPLNFFPDWAQTVLWCTPFPALLQTPVDVFVGHGSATGPILHQLVWLAILLVFGRLLQSRAERKLVIQGG